MKMNPKHLKPEIVSSKKERVDMFEEHKSPNENLPYIEPVIIDSCKTQLKRVVIYTALMLIQISREKGFFCDTCISGNIRKLV